MMQTLCGKTIFYENEIYIVEDNIADSWEKSEACRINPNWHDPNEPIKAYEFDNFKQEPKPEPKIEDKVIEELDKEFNKVEEVKEVSVEEFIKEQEAKIYTEKETRPKRTKGWLKKKRSVKT